MRHNPSWIGIVAATALALLVAVPFFAQHTPSPNSKDEVALRAAMERETVRGDLKGAIEQYKKLARSNDKSVAARALLRMGQSYEKLGSADARKAYEEVLSKFGDQKEVVEQARTLLAALGGPQAVGRIATQKLEDIGILSISPDGRYIAYTDPESGDLAVRDIVSGQRRVLTQESRKYTNGFAETGAPFSPDSRRIAYGWDNIGNGPNGTLELRLVSTDGSGQPRVIFRCNNEITWLVPTAWTPDGKNILAVLFSNRKKILATIDVADGRVRELKTFEGRWSAEDLLTISPDGAYITYNRQARSDSPQHDIMIVSIADLRESSLIENSLADDDSPVWTGDGTSVLFRSDRSGTDDLWLQRVERGRPQGQPELVKSDIGNVGFLGLARNGVLAFNQAVNRRRGYTAQFDPVTGRVSQQLRLSDRAIGPSSPKWSPDGKFLAMTRDRQLVIRTVETGEEREFPMNLITPNALNNNLVPLLSGWFPDGRSVLISGQDTQGKGAFIRYYIDPPQAVVVPVTGTRWIRQSISPDGNTVYTADSNNQSQILAVNVATGATVNVAKAGDGFALSPDGRQFAYITGGQEKDTLYVIGVNGGEPRKVTEFVRPLRARALVWSSDGRHFLVSDRSSAFWVTVDSGTIQNAGITDVGFDMASISPDARHIAFTRGGIGTEAWALENFLPPSSRSR